jgi:hypothetical protein
MGIEIKLHTSWNFSARWKYVGPFMHHKPLGGEMLYLWTGMYMEFRVILDMVVKIPALQLGIKH